MKCAWKSGNPERYCILKEPCQGVCYIADCGPGDGKPDEMDLARDEMIRRDEEKEDKRTA